MGDFNLDLLRHEQHAITGEFVELMFSHLLYNMMTKPTRITSNTTSLIDNIFTNNVTCLSVNGLIVNDLSDHLSIFSISRGGYFFVVFVFFLVKFTRLITTKDGLCSINRKEQYFVVINRKGCHLPLIILSNS